MANIYVRKSGSDSNDGSTPALAKLTIEAAYTALTAGDTIIIGPGIYNITTAISGSKHCTFFGDIYGEYIGEISGDVIISGLNGSYGYISFTNFIKITSTSKSYFTNLLFTNIKTSQSMISTVSASYENCKIFNCYASTVIINQNGNMDISNLSIENCWGDSECNALRCSNYNTETTLNVDNLLISSISTTYGIPYGISLTAGSGIAINVNMKNVTVKNVLSEDDGYGLFHQGGIAKYNLYNCNFINNDKCVSLSYENTGSSIATYNCNSWGKITSDDNWGGGVTHTNLKSIPDFSIPRTPILSRFSPVIGQGYTTFPTTDIDGNPRPAYGNGNACNIGAFESTYENVMREETIKDSGNYSIKVAPCNMFKKTFQIPVTASTLRTVKVKIRIDGTWGTYRPRVSLSGQGITLSQSTKNTTTEEFEELTVSGTPITTGIALLTIEAHATDTSAVFYIDTVTLS